MTGGNMLVGHNDDDDDEKDDGDDDGNYHHDDEDDDDHRFFFQRPNATNPWVNKESVKEYTRWEGGRGLPGQTYYTLGH